MSINYNLKVHVKAINFDRAERLLHDFKNILPQAASMEHINIKTERDGDWFLLGL
jgi:hypothetical protein